MIISHRHQFIFIKPLKTAGTSVELLLSRICGPEDIITPFGNEPDKGIREKTKAKEPQNYFRPKPFKWWSVADLYGLLRTRKIPSMSYWEHIQPEALKSYLGDERWNRYLKISMVRNPWDHAVSWYEFLVRHKIGFKDTPFRDCLINNYRELWPFYTVKGLYSIDYMIRFEHLEADIQRLRQHIPNLETDQIPAAKRSGRAPGDYKRFYETQEMVELVRCRNLNVIEQFNYEF